MGLIKAVAGLAADYLTKEVVDRLLQVVPFRRYSLGILLILGSYILWIAGLMVLIQSIFLHLVNLAHFVLPAVTIACICFFAALAVTLAGVSLIRQA